MSSLPERTLRRASTRDQIRIVQRATRASRAVISHLSLENQRILEVLPATWTTGLVKHRGCFERHSIAGIERGQRSDRWLGNAEYAGPNSSRLRVRRGAYVAKGQLNRFKWQMLSSNKVRKSHRQIVKSALILKYVRPRFPCSTR